MQAQMDVRINAGAATLSACPPVNAAGNNFRGAWSTFVIHMPAPEVHQQAHVWFSGLCIAAHLGWTGMTPWLHLSPAKL